MNRAIEYSRTSFVNDKQIKYTRNDRFSSFRFIVAHDYVAQVFVRLGIIRYKQLFGGRQIKDTLVFDSSEQDDT